MKGIRPRSRLVALEPRLLFDGAAAAAVDQNSDDTQQDNDSRHVEANTASDTRATDNANRASHHLVVVDARLDPAQQQAIIDNTSPDAALLVVDAADNGIDSITSALAGMDDVQSVEIFSHGTDGQFLLGNSHVSADTLPQLEQQLGQWRDALSADADLLLYGCRVGDGASGQQLIDGLADATGADIAASDDDTGEARLGGDWQLEITRGDIDQQTGTDLAGLATMDGLLPAAPTVSLGATSQEVPLGESFDFTVSFSNPSAEIGYAPFIHLYVPTTGKDGAGAETDDGITIESASYVGGSLDVTTITFDANGLAEHPVARDANGNAVIINAADYGYRAGDTLAVVEIPFASFGADQPAIDVTFTATLSDLADTSATDGSPNLDITAIGGFELGHDPLDNPQDDPSVIGTNPSVISIMPTVIDVEQTLNMTEDETATGENYTHSLTTTVRPAGIDPNTQSLTNVVITQPVPTNVQVTNIDPGSGTLTSITLASGQVVTNPTAIQAMIDRDDVFITEYTVEYAELTGAESSTVEFYVPEQDAEGNPIIDPDTGDDVTITFDAPTGSGEWDPIDDRDEPDGGGTVDFSGTGEPINFTAKSIALHKTATIVTDTGTSGLTPGDTLDYQLQMTLSDYFAFGNDSQNQGQFVVTDTLSNGQTVQGTPTMTVTFVDGDSNVQQDVTVELIYTEIDNADGTTTLEFDVAASMEQAFPSQPWLAGDDAFDEVHNGTPTSATINYTTIIDEEYATGVDHPALNEGDSVSNSAVVNADILIDENNTTGFDESDNSNTETTVPTSQVDITIPSGDTELSPGEEVTFTVSYDLITGDHENFTLTVYLPLPLLDTSGINWTEGSGPNTWALNDANTHSGAITSVTSGPGNSLVFTFADVDNAAAPSTIAVDFTMTVGDQPFADQRSLDVLAQSSQTTTLDKNELISEDVVRVQSVAEPVVDITHGVVSSSNGTVSGTDGNWAAPGTTGAPHTGPVTDPSVGDGNVSDIDAGDTLRLATILKNTGGGGAYDVATTIEIPPDLTFVGGSLDAANLILTRGDGTELIEGTDYEVNGNTITLLDADNQATLLAGRDGTDNDNNGLNVIVMTYDVQVVAAVAASRTMGSTATLNHYASVEGGEDFTPNDLSDDATQQVAAPEVSINYKDGDLTEDDSSESHTTDNNLVVGESMDYDIVVTLPEGTTQDLDVSDLIPPGMVLDTSFNSGLGYELIQTTAGSGALSADFAGTVTVGNANADGSLTFTASGADADNDASNNSFVIRLRLIADNTQNNQQGFSHTNDVELSYSDPDGDEVNGATPVDRNVASTGDGVTTTIVEPTVTIDQQLTVPADPGPGVDEGDAVEFTITLGNSSGTDAFDLSVLADLPAQLDGLNIVDVTGSAAATDFEIVNGQLVSVGGANIDLANGASIVITIGGTANASAPDAINLTSDAEVQWTSLNDEVTTSPGTERTGVDGELNSGVLNDYQASNVLEIPVAAAIKLSRVGGLDDTGAADPTDGPSEDVSVGEIIRYRATVLIPEGTSDGYQLRVTLPDGLSFIDDPNTITLALISDNGISSSVTLGGEQITGNEDSDEAQLIADDPASWLTAAINAGLVTLDGQDIVFNLGDLQNTDGDDADFEGFSVEFNVRVNNVASNQAGQSLAVSATDFVNGQQRSESETLTETIVEPGFEGLDKSVVDFDPGTGTTTGNATVDVSFSQNGSMPAYDVSLTDAFPDGTNYTVNTITIDGTTYTPGDLPDGVTIDTSGSLTVNFDQLDPGTDVTVNYSVDVPNDAVVTEADAQATLTWSSLPEDFTEYGDSSVGTDGTADGERNEQDGPGGLNDYILTEGAGLGIISGTLWDDTDNADGTQDGGEAGFDGQDVTLTWAGADGQLDTADDENFVITTDANGQYQFGVLPTGLYRITAANEFSDTDAGDVRARFDSDGGTYGDGSLSSITINLGEGGDSPADIGYVQLNEAPVNNLPGTAPVGDEDTIIPINGLSISDPDARDPASQAGANQHQVVLEVTQGTLNITNAGGATLAGNGSATLTITGSVAQVNAALSNLTYQGILNFNGEDTLTMTTSDQGNFGDHPIVDQGNGIPGETADALTDIDTLTITVNAVNDDPTANDDAGIAVEAGGTDNNQVGIDPNGFVLNNDEDVDIATNDDVLTVTQAGVDADTLQTVDADPSQTTEVIGQYGTMIIGSDGFAQYIVDNDNPEVEALRQSGDTLTETFTYEIADLAGVTSQATITVTIQGANDTPVAADDTGTAIEAGGVNNGSGGQNANGNVLTNDTDVDEFGETQAVSGIRVGDKELTDAFTDVSAGSTSGNGASIVGDYGTLTIGADGSYEYVIDNDNVDVQRLTDGQTLTETFSYRVADAGGLIDVANLTITIDGNQDNPVATDNSTTAQAPSTDGSTPAENGLGNLITDDDGDGVDDDVDEVDRPNTNLSVNGIRTGAEADGGALTDVTAATDVTGNYGTLTVNTDGRYEYVVDGSNPDVQALDAGETISETFTYQLVDTDGNTDLAQLVATITGANDPPTPVDDDATAIEAGGVDNGTPGVDPTGNVLDNDSDVDGQALEVSEFSQDTTSATAGDSITGAYGTLTLNADGSYSYVLDNDNPEVQALRLASDTLSEAFTYTIVDTGGASTSAVLTITIEGRNDTPVANDDNAVAVEAGGIDNGTPGSDASGNVLDNDNDVDSVANGETKSVVSASQGTDSAQAGESLAGQYGTLILNADGSYSYELDNDNPDVEALRTSGQTLTENFDYVMQDTAGATSQAALTIVIQGANDTPVANDDGAVAVEAGGVANGTPGVDPTGNVLDNDSDVDSADNGETQSIVSVSQGTDSVQAGESLAGQYGSLTVNADGSYTYVVDNDNPTVQALRTAGETLTENFDYVMQDTAGATSQAVLTIVIQGANDTPVANDDTATAVEAGGTDNGTPGTDPSGNVLDNDTDVDDGDTKTVNGIRTGTEAAGGSFQAVGTSHTIAGTYGSLTINDDGSFTYVVDNSLDVVQQLVEGESLSETFSYHMLDTAGASDIAQLTLTIEGAWDAPVADNNLAFAVAENVNGTGRNPDGNVLDNDTDVDGNDSLGVGAIRTGEEIDGGTLTDIPAGGLTLDGQYGTLTINPDGSYLYEVDNTNPDVIALDPTAILNDYFTYEAVDQGGLTDLAQLRVVIRGGNEAPVAEDDGGNAVESGGLDNAIVGSPATGNVLDNDVDPDADVGPSPGDDPNLQVIGIRTGPEDGGGTDGTVGGVLEGEYGSLILNSDGSYTYEVDDDNPEVQALRQSGQTLVDEFTYTINDRWGAEDSGQLSITIDGRNDTPIANDDDAQAVEAGGLNNGTSGVNPTGNVLDNDTDVDGTEYGETKAVISVSQGSNSALAGQTLQGRYGTLIVNADGSYTYEVDNDNPTVQALRAADQTLTERFDYVMRDTAGDTSQARLTIVIQGANDTPVANDDTATAVEAGGADNGTPGVDPSGNVLDNDADVDGTNRGETTTVVTVSQGANSVQAGQSLTGQFGTLIVNADGSYTYQVDNDNPEVQALRVAGQTLNENFTYVISDTAGDTSQAVLTIVIQGANDTPVANDDDAIAVEAGGIENGTPGVDPDGNVLDNDTDVDGTEYGETKAVISVSQGSNSALAGQTLQGRYGTLIVNADGSYTYEVDNDNPTVQALRTAGETLTERFDYVMRDTTGDTSSARLTIIVEGANDNPVARDDSNVASDQTPEPQATGNVLPNDSDVDGGDSREVVDVRPVDDDGTITAGQPLYGRYGTLVLNADGSYEYVIDMTNSEVLQAAGRGPILQDVLVYRIGDLAGASASANLTITLDIAAPYIPVGGDADPYHRGQGTLGSRPGADLGFEPIVYITPEVERNNIEVTNYLRISDSGNPWMVRPFEQQTFVGADIGQVGGQFVGRMVAVSQAFHEQDQMILLGRHGRTNLSADGLLPDPSIHAATRSTMLEGFRPAEGAGTDDNAGVEADAEARPTSNTDDRRTTPQDGAARTEQQRTHTAQGVDDKAPEAAAQPIAPGFRQQLQVSNSRLAPLTLESDS